MSTAKTILWSSRPREAPLHEPAVVWVRKRERRGISQGARFFQRWLVKIELWQRSANWDRVGRKARYQGRVVLAEYVRLGYDGSQLPEPLIHRRPYQQILEPRLQKVEAGSRQPDIGSRSSNPSHARIELCLQRPLRLPPSHVPADGTQDHREGDHHENEASTERHSVHHPPQETNSRAMSAKRIGGGVTGDTTMWNG